MTFTFPTPATAAPFWRDMPGNEAEASLILEVAKGQCLAYAPALPADSLTYAPVTLTEGGLTATFTRIGDVVTVDFTTTGVYGEVLMNTLPGAFHWQAGLEVYHADWFMASLTGVGNYFAAGSGEPGTHQLRYVGLPATPTVQTIPENYFLAIITQARNIANAGVAPVGGGDFDGSGHGVTTYPLDWTVKQMLRPERGLGAVV